MTAKRSKAERRAARKRKASDRVPEPGPVSGVTVTRVTPDNQAEVIDRMSGARGTR